MINRSPETQYRPLEKQTTSDFIADLFNKKLREGFNNNIELQPDQLLKINSPESIIELASTRVTEIWNQEISEIFYELVGIWEKSIDDGDANSHIKKILKNPKYLESLVKIRYFSEFTDVRYSSPEILETLVNISILRQQWEMFLLENWIEQIPDNKFENWGIEKNQFLLSLQLTNEIGPLVSKGFLMQLTNSYDHLLPNKIKFPQSEGNNTSWTYEVIKFPQVSQDNHQTNDILEESRLSLKQAFPQVVPLIIEKYRIIAEKTLLLYPEKGKRFAEFLLAVANAYDSSETDFNNITKIWEDVEKFQAEIVKSEWPIDLIVIGEIYITGPLKKADFNLDVGLSTKESKRIQSENIKYSKIAKKISSKYEPNQNGKLKYVTTDILLAGMGPNLLWRNQGVADKIIFTYSNSIEDVSRETVFPFHKGLFQPDNIDYKTDDEMIELSTISTAVHELGHTILSMNKALYTKRVGYYQKHSEMIEEIKADTNGIRIFWEDEKTKPNFGRAKKMLEFVVSYYASYVASSGSDYNESTDEDADFNTYREMAGIVICALIDSGALKITGEKFEIVDVEAGFNAIVEISDKVLKEYSNPFTTPALINKFCREIEKNNRENTGFREFMKIVSEIEITS
ncbi:hypothetical protein KA111_00285 [Candidatus Woesebacteria bacterium]|nr:hypothetical protein [Candidatus Woesebacteria bacterium]